MPLTEKLSNMCENIRNTLYTKRQNNPTTPNPHTRSAASSNNQSCFKVYVNNSSGFKPTTPQKRESGKRKSGSRLEEQGPGTNSKAYLTVTQESQDTVPNFKYLAENTAGGREYRRWKRV
uniref:Uncharacterized protein n=1 Tax=Cacopsylla melanoneura TaxID=428564 RepID=A0A8D9B616_9HEMI